MPKNVKKWAVWVSHTSDPGAEDIDAVRSQWLRSSGWIYAAKVGSMWKIGMTGRRNPFERINELKSSVSATENFELVWAVQVLNRFVAEKVAHKNIVICGGSHESKEFFQTTVDSVKSIFRNIEKEERDTWAGWDVDKWFSEGVCEFEWDRWCEKFIQ
jgi:T5orf172 domain